MPFEKFQEEELPTGKIGEMNKAFRENLFLFGKVKNKVAFVNEEVITPLELKEGEQSPLGLFAEASLPEKFQKELPPDKQRLEVRPEHRRSALLERIIFEDKQGRPYRDIDLKGIGYIIGGEIKKPGEIYLGTSREGLLDSDMAFYDYQLSEEFLRAGIRTNRVLAIIDLEELIVEEKKISLEEARKRHIINKKFQPVIEVRAFATKARISEIPYSKLDRGWEIKNDAIKLVSQELGRGDKPLSDKEYLEWFAKTLGQNVGLLHKNGWYHDYLNPHNITLDCRIVDLDGVTELSNEYNQLTDLHNAQDSLRTIMKRLGFILQFDFFNDQFLKSYNAVFPPEEREKYFSRKKEG